jgi:hypothetical protein
VAGSAALGEAQRAIAIANDRLESARARGPVVRRVVDALLERAEPNNFSARFEEMLRRGYGSAQPHRGP